LRRNDLLAPAKDVRILCAPQAACIRSRYVPSISKINHHYSLSPLIMLDESILSAVLNIS
jgi:hypothetical protein